MFRTDYPALTRYRPDNKKANRTRLAFSFADQRPAKIRCGAGDGNRTLFAPCWNWTQLDRASPDQNQKFTRKKNGQPAEVGRFLVSVGGDGQNRTADLWVMKTLHTKSAKQKNPTKNKYFQDYTTRKPPWTLKFYCRNWTGLP